jgi:hypothetical protein
MLQLPRQTLPTDGPDDPQEFVSPVPVTDARSKELDFLIVVCIY